MSKFIIIAEKVNKSKRRLILKSNDDFLAISEVNVKKFYEGLPFIYESFEKALKKMKIEFSMDELKSEMAKAIEKDFF